MHWVNRKGRYPYVSRETWVTRFWLWCRVAERRWGTKDPTGRRVAAVLQQTAEQANAPAELREDLFQWLKAYDALHGQPLADSVFGRERTRRSR